MEEFIKTDEGVFIIKHYGKDFKIELFEEPVGSYILPIKYYSNLSIIDDENKINNLFEEYEPQIIQIIKTIVSENVEFYQHFNIDFSFESLKSTTNNRLFSRGLKIQLKA